MTLPKDYDRDLWLDPLTFQDLVGATIASRKVEYRDLFREDGFVKPTAQLRENKHIAKLIDGLNKW